MQGGESKRFTALMWACYSGDLDAVQLLLLHGASVTDIDSKVGCLSVCLSVYCCVEQKL